MTTFDVWLKEFFARARVSDDEALRGAAVNAVDALASSVDVRRIVADLRRAGWTREGTRR